MAAEWERTPEFQSAFAGDWLESLALGAVQPQAHQVSIRFRWRLVGKVGQTATDEINSGVSIRFRWRLVGKGKKTSASGGLQSFNPLSLETGWKAEKLKAKSKARQVSIRFRWRLVGKLYVEFQVSETAKVSIRFRWRLVGKWHAPRRILRRVAVSIRFRWRLVGKDG